MKRTLSIVLIVLAALSLVLTASALVDKNNDQDNGDNGEKVTICHKTGSAKNPYVEITLSVNGATHGHAKHAGDLIPAPQGGCPGAVADTEGNDIEEDEDTANKITICHRTGNAKHPYVEITVLADATTDGHGTHEGDLIPAPEGGCPATLANP